jgi:hypothetical protein
VPDLITWKRLTVFIVILCWGLISFSQQTDYKKIFGSDWVKAEAFVSENWTWMKQLSGKYDVEYSEAIAIVFPELVRYSALRDKMEITLLKALYINLGEDYANFSIGQFQMKPSFAESIQNILPVLKGNLRNRFMEKTAYKDIREYRSAIVRDLEDPESQFLYLIAFLKICKAAYDLKGMEESQKIRFLATAYNYSFLKSFGEVERMSDESNFHTKLAKSESYSYADISAYWYKNFQNNK